MSGLLLNEDWDTEQPTAKTSGDEITDAQADASQKQLEAMNDMVLQEQSVKRGQQKREEKPQLERPGNSGTHTPSFVANMVLSCLREDKTRSSTRAKPMASSEEAFTERRSSTDVENLEGLPADIHFNYSKIPDPLLVIDVCQDSNPNAPLSIRGYAISPSGRYVGTLAVVDKQGCIDLWDLGDANIKPPSPAVTHAARAAFEWNVEAGHGLSISSAGHVVLFEAMNPSFEFTLYTFDPLFTPGDSKAISSSTSIKPATNTDVPDLQLDTSDIPLLKGLAGHGKFVASEQTGQADRFIFCNGRSVQLFSTDGPWQCIYKTRISNVTHLDCARTLVESAQANSFVWCGGSVELTSIWSTSTGRLRSTAPQSSSLISISFSENGDRMAVSDHYDLHVYAVNSGIVLANSAPHRETSFVMDDSKFMCRNHQSILDAKTLVRTGSYPKIQVLRGLPYSVVPGTRGTRAIAVRGSLLEVFDIEELVAGCNRKCRTQSLEVDQEIKSFHAGPDLWFEVDMKNEGEDGVLRVDMFQTGEDPKKILSLKLSMIASAFFLKRRPILVVITQYGNTFWQVPTKDGDVMELVLFWGLQWGACEIHASCEHEKRLSFSRPWGDEFLKVWHLDSILTKDTAEDFFGAFSQLPEFYQTSNTTVKKAIVRYANFYINNYPDPNNLSVSVMYVLCSAWTSERQAVLETFMRDLLANGKVKWLPLEFYPEGSNLLSILLQFSVKQPKVLALINIIIDHCVKKAQEDRNVAYLSVVYSCLDELMKQFPEAAQGFLHRALYLPVADRAAVINNHVLVHPPTLRRFWIPNQQPLHLTPNPILQFRLILGDPNPIKDNFTQDLFIASFDLLWPRRYSDADFRKNNAVNYNRSWFRTLLDLAMICTGVRSSQSSGSRAFRTAHFDNPAMEALIQYKWNTFGYAVWLIRFLWQSVFYVLVITAAFVQIYAEEKTALMGVFSAIITMAVFFLWLEILQCWDHPRLYLTSPYNYLDLAAFVLPAAASASQIMNILNEDQHGNKSILSFSIIIIFLHLLSELRVIRTVCKYVTIVLQVLQEIQIFFIVFAMGILTFSLAFLHLLHGCPVNGCLATSEEFPTNFFGAVSSTYFIMGGRYDPVNTELGGERWDIHIMSMIYFFFTAILMLNVLIALISVGFNKGDESWRLVWLENRLHYVKSAENMSHYVPGFRDRYDWFPKEIYYTASANEMDAYRTKYDLKVTEEVKIDDGVLGGVGRSNYFEDADDDGSGALINKLQVTVEELKMSLQASDARAVASDLKVDELHRDLKAMLRILQ